MKILLLEDNKTLNETIKLQLELVGYKVYSYIDGDEAYNNLEQGFSCFVLDVNVPNINGIKILKKIREYYKEIPIIIISATIDLDIIKESYHLGCDDFIKKPFYIDELEIKINKLCKVNEEKISFGTNKLFDFNNSNLILDEKIIQLNNKENLLMNLFLTKQNSLVSYKNIEDYVYKGDYASLDAMRTLIKRLRKKLDNPYIQVLSNKGYIFKNNTTI